MKRRYEVGDRFHTPEQGRIEIIEKPDPADEYDYYVKYLSAMRPDRVGWNEDELYLIEKIED